MLKKSKSETLNHGSIHFAIKDDLNELPIKLKCTARSGDRNGQSSGYTTVEVDGRNVFSDYDSDLMVSPTILFEISEVSEAITRQ